jgi:hypothetical protein
LEERVFEMTGLAMATLDADEADDNMSTNPEEEKEEQLQLAWKKLIHRLWNVPAKAHSKIRQAVVEAIAAARTIFAWPRLRTTRGGLQRSAPRRIRS